MIKLTLMRNKNLLFACSVCLTSFSFAQQFVGATTQTGAIYRAGSVGVGVTTVPTALDFVVQHPTNKSGKFILGNTNVYGAFTNSESVAQIYNQNSVRSAVNVISASSNTSNLLLSLNANLTGTNTGISLVATSAANKKSFVFDMYGTNALIINTTGQVGIGTGTTSLGTTKLAVNGTIGAREVKVTLATAWPDYVFAKEYKRKSFDELNVFLNTEKHLPYMPVAAEVEKEGTQSLGETQQNMLRSLEELYLYVLDLKKENNDLKKEIENLKNK